MTFLKELDDKLNSANWSRLEKNLFIENIHKEYLEDYISEVQQHKWYKINDLLNDSLNFLNGKKRPHNAVVNYVLCQTGKSIEHDNLIDYCTKKVGKQKAPLYFLHLLTNYDIHNKEELGLIVAYRKTNHFKDNLNFITAACTPQSVDDLSNDKFYKSMVFLDRLDDIINDLIKLRPESKEWVEIEDKKIRLLFFFSLPYFDTLYKQLKFKKDFSNRILEVCGMDENDFSPATISRYVRATVKRENGRNNILRDNADKMKKLLNEYNFFDYSETLNYYLSVKNK